MDFAKKQLEKYGWSEGKGLGKNEDGISAALKPKLKFDTTGVGHDAGEEFTNNWWNNVYNSALNNIEVKSENGNIKVNLKTKESVEISTNSYVQNKGKNYLEYGNFVKTEKLTPAGVINLDTTKTFTNNQIPKIPIVSDEELFAACGGRTAHKGARHGLKLSGKLSRIEKQEKMLLKKLQKVTLTEDKHHIKKKLKKISDNKEYNIKQHDDGMILDDYDSRSSTGSITPKKKCKKKKKSVSFNDTVTEYITYETHDEDCSQSIINPLEIEINGNSTIKLIKAKEIDSEIKPEDNMKKKKKSKKHTATAKFLENMYNEEIGKDFQTRCNSKNNKSKKRKLHECIDDDIKCLMTIKKNKRKKKKRRKEEKRINHIAESLDQICKISDSERI